MFLYIASINHEVTILYTVVVGESIIIVTMVTIGQVAVTVYCIRKKATQFKGKSSMFIYIRNSRQYMYM